MGRRRGGAEPRGRPGAPRGGAPCLVANGIEPEFKSLQTATAASAGQDPGEGPQKSMKMLGVMPPMARNFPSYFLLSVMKEAIREVSRWSDLATWMLIDSRSSVVAPGRASAQSLDRITCTSLSLGSVRLLVEFSLQPGVSGPAQPGCPRNGSTTRSTGTGRRDTTPLRRGAGAVAAGRRIGEGAGEGGKLKRLTC